MKKILILICTLLCANVLLAQTRFWVGDLQYEVLPNPAKVKVCRFQNNPGTVIIPETVSYEGTTYSVVAIHYSAFYNCSSLTSITIPNSVIYIEEKAFRGCSSLTSVTCLAETAPMIGSNVFEYTPDTKTLIVACGVDYSSWEDSTTWANIQYTDFDIFRIGNLKYEKISNTEVKIIDCNDSVTEIIIPLSVEQCGISYNITSIGSGAFNGCSGLTSITIPNSVTSIGSGAFANCSFLQNITCLATTPPTLEDNTVFPYPNIATLTVPCGTLEAYSAPTSFWNMFFAGRISEDGYEVVANVNNDAFGSVAIENNCSTATLTATANEGYVFLSWNDGNTENPRVVSLTSDTSFVANFALIDESSLLEAEAESISFFPNPTKSEITFSQAIEKIEVIDLTGKTILTFTNAKTINIESLPAGAYYLRLTNEEKTSLQKVIKQ